MQRLAREAVRRLGGLKVTEPTIDASVLELPFRAHAGQKEWWSCRDEALDEATVCGHQSGKTRMEPRVILRDIQDARPLIYFFGECRYIFAGPTFTLMDQQAIGYFRDVFEDELQLGKYKESGKPKFVFSDEGCERLFGFIPRRAIIHFPYTHDSSNIESMRAIGAMWDEAGQKENKLRSYYAIDRRLTVARAYNLPGKHREEMWGVWEAAGGRRLPHLFGRRHIVSTPYERNWFKTLIVDKAVPLERYLREKRLAARQGRPYEGVYVLHNWPTWETGLMTEAQCRRKLERGEISEDEFDMMYRGIYARPTGAIFTGFTA